MMKTIQKEQAINLPLHTTIVGKWNGKAYIIRKSLGFGAIGHVYLAELNGRTVALKISKEESAITSEVNILKKLKATTDDHFKNMFIECDDWFFQEERYYFYSMTYIDGEDLVSFINANGQEWLPVIMSQLLHQLDVLHSFGYIFGDLKPENIKIKNTPPTVRLLDVGGVTNIGRAVKQYTEFFDRGYWSLGTRKAEVTYDLFAAAMIMVSVIKQKTFTKKLLIREQTLIDFIYTDSDFETYSGVIGAALEGRFKTAVEMRQYILSPDSMKRIKRKPLQSNRSSGNMKRKRQKRQFHLASIIETVVIILFLALSYGFYLLAQ